jgi:hypothetical protein
MLVIRPPSPKNLDAALRRSGNTAEFLREQCAIYS